MPSLHLNLRLKLLLILLLVGVLPLVATGVLNIWLTSGLLRQSQIDDEQTRLQGTVNDIERFLQTTTNDVLILSESTAMAHIAQVIIEGDSLGFQQARQDLMTEFENYIARRSIGDQHIYERIRFLDSEGFELVRVDSNATGVAGLPPLNFRSTEAYFTQARDLPEGEVYVSSVFLFEEYGQIQTPHTPVMHYGTPVYAEDTLVGVLVTDVRAQGFLDLVQTNLLPHTKAFLVDQNGYYLSHPDPDSLFGRELKTDIRLQADYPTLAMAFESGKSDVIELENNIVVYQSITPPGQQDFYWVLFSLRPFDAVLNPVRQQERTLLLGFVLVGTVVSIIALYFARSISHPIIELTQTSTSIANGELKQRVRTNRRDELGMLAHSFNSMTEQMSALIDNLEERVNARTRDLQVAANVSKQITTVLDINQLLQQVVVLTATNFHFYSAVIFLKDDNNRLVPRAGANAQGHQLELDDFVNISIDNSSGIVALAAQTQRAVCVNDVTQSAIYTPHNAFPNTRAELAIPILLGKKLLGVFDLQSQTLDRFGEDDLRVLTTLAEQIAVAVRNAQLFAKAQAAQRTAEMSSMAKSIFLTNMSHELRTPLNSILGFSQLIRRDPNTTPDQHERLDIISRSGEHLLRLINDVLEMSKIEAGKVSVNITTFDLYHMLHSLEEMMKVRAEKRGLALTVEYGANVPQYVKTDENKLRQVLINLIGNAVKFTDIGGIAVRISYPESERLLFEVEDTGCGIKEPEQEQLFEAFTQTESGRELQQGTGLGLSISRQFVRFMGGDISVRSQVGVGSTFCFDIQVQEASFTPNIPGRRQVTATVPMDTPLRILIVEDNWEGRLLLVELLEPLGFEVLEAVNGQEAIDLCEAWQPHLVFMDLRMPVMDGYEATQRIKAMSPDTIVIALTASVFEHERLRALSIGCDDFIRKPFHDNEIFDKLTQFLGVQFIYEDQKQPTPNQPHSDRSISADDLSILPADWVNELHRIAMTARAKELLTIIERIRPEYPEIAQGLTELVNNFRFDTIMTLTEATLSQV